MPSYKQIKDYLGEFVFYLELLLFIAIVLTFVLWYKLRGIEEGEWL